MAEWCYTDGNGAFLEVPVNNTLSLYGLSTIEKFPMPENLKAHRYRYLQRQGNDLNRVLPNRRSLCSAPDHSNAFKKYLRSIHLRANKRDRLIKAIQEYNRLY